MQFAVPTGNNPKETGVMSTHDALLLALGYAWGVALMGAGWWLLG